VQFPLLNLFDVSAGVYGLAMVLAVVAVYALVIGCSYFPSRQAAWIYPAEALREE
jgi:putative ABC transport system permease protein